MVMVVVVGTGVAPRTTRAAPLFTKLRRSPSNYSDDETRGDDAGGRCKAHLSPLRFLKDAVELTVDLFQFGMRRAGKVGNFCPGLADARNLGVERVH